MNSGDTSKGWRPRRPFIVAEITGGCGGCRTLSELNPS
jgi:hypothetical protein